MKKFDQFCSNLAVLGRAGDEELGNEFIVGGIIDKFYVQFELGWKVLKELLRYEGLAVSSSGSPREIIKAAYSIWDFLDEKTWLDMLRLRNDMTHLYNGAAAKELALLVINTYTAAFMCMRDGILNIYGKKLDDMP